MIYHYRNRGYLMIFYLDDEQEIRFRKGEHAQR